ncbi:MAG: tetratricopeptide repeat protein, partial [Nitrosotalea sp.]
NKGLALYNLSKYEEATSCFDKVLEINPKDVYALKAKESVLNRINRK